MSAACTGSETADRVCDVCNANYYITAGSCIGKIIKKIFF